MSNTQSPQDTDNHSLEDKNKKTLDYIEDVTSNADMIQRKLLQEILSSNANVEYLQVHGLNGRTDKDTFKKMVPVVAYEDIQLDIERVVNGDTSPIFCSKPISQFVISSCISTGETKLMPFIEEELERRALLYSLMMSVMNKSVPGLERGKSMYFLSIRPETKTPSGLKAQAALSIYYRSSYFNNRSYDNPYSHNTSPYDTILCPDPYESMYSQLLCGLCQNKQIQRIGSVFATGFIEAIDFLKKHWPSLCNDIRTGKIDAQIIDQSVQDSVMKILKPDPELANFIEMECRKDYWQGIVTRLWPNTKYVDAIVTGTLSQYIPTIDYYTNGLPIASCLYASSECYFGINLEPLCNPSDVSYTLIPTMAYFEFLPVYSDDKEEQQELVDLVHVEMGQEYELVITTYAGLYRYRVGDVLQVSGFKNNTPQFKFLYRRNVVLRGKKTDKQELQYAAKYATDRLGPYEASEVHYTSLYKQQ